MSDEEGREVWWCEEHDAPSVWWDGSLPSLDREPWCFSYDVTGHDVPDQKPCRMVLVRVVPVRGAAARAGKDQP